MDVDITTLLNNPAFQLFAISNGLIALIVGAICWIVLRQIVKANDRVSEGSSKVLEMSLGQTKTANTALGEMAASVVKKVESVLDALTEHDVEVQKHHEQTMTIQQIIADTLKSLSANLAKLTDTTQTQAELTASHVSIMEDLSQANIQTHTAIETKIAPVLEDIKGTMQSMVDKLETMTTAGVQEKTEILDAIRRMTSAFDTYASLLEQQLTPDESAATPVVVSIPMTIGIPAEQVAADIPIEDSLAPVQEIVTP